MKTYQCVVKSYNTGKELVLIIRAYDEGSARREATLQGREKFGCGCDVVKVTLM